jgi:diaminopimelate epimerase
MRIRFTKMQGAGNDFVVLDETRGPLGLSAAQYRFLADRHFGVGADQILSVRPSPGPGLDFEYVIHNADGGEVEHCGNGARCFVRYVHDKGLTDRNPVRVKVKNGEISLAANPDGRVTVDMGAPVFDLARVPFHAPGLRPEAWAASSAGPCRCPSGDCTGVGAVHGQPARGAAGRRRATAPVLTWGPLIERHAAFPQRVNAGFLQVLDRNTVRLRVYERGAGETLACGTGACAAVVAGIRLGLLDGPGRRAHPRRRADHRMAGHADPRRTGDLMTGPATTVFEGEIELPDTL